MSASNDPPGPKNRWFGFVHLPAIRRDFLRFSHELWKMHGDVVAYHVAGQQVFQFARPEHAHEILVMKSKAFDKPKNQKRAFGRILGEVLFISDGAVWTKRRRVLGPVFQPQIIESYRRLVIRQAETVFASLSPGETNISHAMSDIALMSVAEALFGSSVHDVADEFRRTTARLQEAVARQVSSLLLMPLWVPTRDNRTVRASMRFLDGLVERLIEQRLSSKASHQDLLTFLLNATDEEGGGGLSKAEVRSEAVTMLLAGSDTTAAALSWSAYLLARHRDVQEALYEEVHRANPAGTRAPGSAEKLPLAEQVFKESMRLYPPAPAIVRQANDQVEIGSTRVPRGALAFVLVYTLHHDARYYPGPESFRPERFSPDREQATPDHAYLPFGLGPRACIGRGFAMMEGPLILAELVRRYRFELAEGQDEPELETQISLHPKGGVRLRLLPREAQVLDI